MGNMLTRDVYLESSNSLLQAEKILSQSVS